MSIEKRLKYDAARFSELQPPEDLRDRLQASLDAVPPMHIPVQSSRRVHRWFAPAIGVLTMAMLFVFITAAPLTTAQPPGDESWLMSSENEPDTDDARAEDPVDVKTVRATATADVSRPWARIGIFAGLALTTGVLCVTELKGRPKLLVPALAVLALFAVAGLLSMYGV